MPIYRRPIQISASKIPAHLISSDRLSLPRGGRAPGRRPLESTKPSAAPVALDRDQQSITLTLPIPPSINHQYATVNGRRLLSSTGRSYKAQVGQLVWMRLTAFPHRNALLTHLQSSALALSIRFYFTSALRRDVDGGLKIAQDALCEGLGLNDNRIIETHLYKHVDRANPRIEVLLAPAIPS